MAQGTLSLGGERITGILKVKIGTFASSLFLISRRFSSYSKWLVHITYSIVKICFVFIVSKQF